MKKFLFAASAAMMLLALGGCSDDNSPKPDPTPQLKPGAIDIVGGRMIHCIDVNKLEEGGIPVDLLNEIKVTLDDNSHINFHIRTEADGSKFIVPELKQPLEKGDQRFVRLKVAMRDNPDVARNILVLLYNPEDEETRAGVETDYTAYLGKGTSYFGELGNTTRSVLLYNKIDMEDENAVTALTTLNRQEMLEIEGSNYEQTMTTWQLNVGLSAKMPIASRTEDLVIKNGFFTKKKGRSSQTISGSINVNVNGMDASSNSYEYYLNFIKVEKAWVKINTEYFLGDELSGPSKDLVDIVSADVISDFFKDTVAMSDEAAKKFFMKWGTDVITSGLFGGYAMYLYGRTENTYETSVGFDANVSARRSTPGSSEGVENDWAKIYTKTNGGSYQNIDLGGGMQDQNYEKATQSVSYSKYLGGSNSLDAEKWLDGFADSKHWSIISYIDAPLKEDDKCALTSIHEVLSGLVDYYLEYVAEPCDAKVIDAMNEKVITLSNQRAKYVEDNMVQMKAKTRLILADVMMKKGRNNHKNGDPQPFVAENPRFSRGDKLQYLIYYPIMANRNAPIDRGYAIDTSQDKYYVIGDDYDHYWYYAMAPEDQVTGIHDIIFKDKEEDGYKFRGDHPDQGWVSVTKNRTCIKYYLDDPTATRKLTAFGLYIRDGDSGAFTADRIIGSTGGSELSMMATTAETTNWKNFWNKSGFYNKTQWAEGGVSVNTKLWPCMTTEPLPIERISNRNVTHPKKWGE